MKNSSRKKFHLFTLLCILHSSFTSNILRLSDQNQAIFSLRYVNKRHATSPYKKIDTENLYECVDSCVYETSCKSVNVNDTRTPWKCELVSDDRNSLDSYVNATGVKHYDTGWSSVTRITNNDGSMCIVNEDRSCDVTDTVGQVKIETDPVKCQALYAYWNFDPRTGRITHHCSGLRLCVLAPVLSGADVKLSNDCPTDGIDMYDHAWRRDFRSYLFYSGFCIQAVFNQWGLNRRLQITTSCTTAADSKRFKFTNTKPPPVQVLLFEVYPPKSPYSAAWAYVLSNGYPNTTHWDGYQDDMIIPNSLRDYYVAELRAYFVAPVSGTYDFHMSCDDGCELFINNTVYIDHTAQTSKFMEIITSKEFQFASSKPWLNRGQRYYMQARLWEATQGDVLAVQMKLPGTDQFVPITSRFLQRYP